MLALLILCLGKLAIGGDGDAMAYMNGLSLNDLSYIKVAH